MQHFDDLPGFFTALQGMETVKATVGKLQELYQDSTLFVEILCLRLVGDIVAAGTYRLESDGFVLPFVTGEVQHISNQLSRVVEHGKLPELPAEAMLDLKKFARDALSTSPNFTPTIREEIKAKLGLTYTYFKQRFKGEGATDAERRLDPLLACARAAELLRLAPRVRDLADHDICARMTTAPPSLFGRISLSDPSSTHETDKPNWTQSWLLEYHAAKVEALTLSPYTEPVTDMFAMANGEYCYSWWQKRAAKFPMWSNLTRTLATLQASSGTVERVFSLYKRVCQEDNSLMDYRRARVIIPYNARMRKTPVVSVQ